MSIANVTKSNGDAKVGFIGGAEFEYQATDIVSLTFGALYSMQGAKVPSGTDLKLDYINVPVLANVYVAPGLAVKLGLQPGFLVSDNSIGTKSFDLSIPVGLSYEFNNFVIDGRYNLGAIKIWEPSDSKNSVFQVTLGYKFDL